MFKRRIQIAVVVAVLVGGNAAGLLAQTTIADAANPDAANPDAANPDAANRSVPKARGEFLRVQYLEATANPVARASGAAEEAWAAPESWDGATAVAPAPAPVAVDGSALPMPHRHQVIQAPRIVHPHGNHPWPQVSDRTATANPAHPLPHLIGHHTRHVAPAVIPDGTLREVWKSPFSYGYFGARGSRRWIRHFGYRDRDTEWRLR